MGGTLTSPYAFVACLRTCLPYFSAEMRLGTVECTYILIRHSRTLRLLETATVGLQVRQSIESIYVAFSVGLSLHNEIKEK